LHDLLSGLFLGNAVLEQAWHIQASSNTRYFSVPLIQA